MFKKTDKSPLKTASMMPKQMGIKNKVMKDNVLDALKKRTSKK